MAVLGRLQLSSAERLDLPDMLSVDSFTAADFKFLIQTFVGGTTPYILKGFDVIQPQDSIATESLSIRISDSAVYFPNSSSGSFFVGLEEGNPNALPLIPELRKNAVNFVYATFTTSDTAQDSRAFWDPDQNGGEGGEFSQDINTESVLTVQIGTSVSSFPENTIPIAKITVGPAVITAIEDTRDLMFRLGTGGLNADPFNSYTFREEPAPAFARLEPSGVMTNAAQPNPFQGGDKNILSLKEWMDVVMTRITELAGTTFWYEGLGGPGPSLGNVFKDALGSTLHCKGDWEHDNTVAGRVTWSEDIKYNTLIDPRQLVFRAGTLDIATNDTVAYFQLIRDAEINGTTTKVDWVNGSTAVNGPIGAFDNLAKGDWIKQKIDDDVLYLRVEELYTLPALAGATTTGSLAQSIKLSAGYAGATGTFLAVYTKGEFLQTDAVISSRDAGAITALGGDFYWFAHRYDTILSQGSVVRTDLSLALSDADGSRLTCTHVGHGLVDNDRVTLASSPWAGTYQVEVEDADIFYINTTAVFADQAGVPAHYAIVTTDATSTADGYDLETAEHGFESGQRIVLADTSSAFDGGYLCNVRSPTTIQIPTPSAIAVPTNGIGTVELPRVNVRVSFGFAKVVQGEQINIGDPETSNILDFIGMDSLAETSPTYTIPNAYNALNGHANFNTLASDNLTDRAAKLTAMMADRVQDRGLRLIGEVNITHETNAAFQDITASGTLTIKKPSSPDQVLTLTASLPANSAAVATIDRDGGAAIGLTVEDLDTAYALGENKIIVFYRFGTTDIYTWDSERIPTNGHFNTGVAEYSGNRNVTVFNPTNAVLNNTTGLITLDTTLCPEITDIVCQSVVSAGLNTATGLYWTLNSALDATSYYVWYRVTDGIPPADPAPGGTGIMVDVLLADTATDVATKTAAAIDALGDFNAVSNLGYVTVTNAATGPTTDSAAGTSGFTIHRIANATDHDIDLVIHGSADNNTVDVAVINALGTLIVPAESAVWVRIDRDANKIFNQILTADAPATTDTTAAGALFITPITDVPIDHDVFVLFMRRGDSLMELHKAVHPDENVYEEFLDVVAGIPANDNEITGPLPLGSTIFLPADSRNMDFVQRYIVGAGHLNLELNGQRLRLGIDYSELGTVGCETNKIQIDQPLIVGDELGFRIDGRGSVYFAAPSGTNASMQDIYDNGRFITTISGQPLVIAGPAAEKLVSIQGDLEVTGVIDPTGLQFTPITADPMSGPGIWVDDVDGDLIWNQSTAVRADSVKIGAGLTEITQTEADILVTLTVGGDITSHHHDSRYYTETELNAGQLDNQYYTETELDAGQLDNRYYTETELNAGQLDTLYYTETELDAGQLDNRYYTETELDAGQLDNRYYTETELDAGQLDTRYYTETESDTLFVKPAGISVLTNKDIDGGTASNTSRITLPKDTTANLDLLTDKEATVAYDTTLNTLVINDGAAWNPISGGDFSIVGPTTDSMTIDEEDNAGLTGTGNTFYGKGGGSNVTGGSNNTVIGALAGATLTNNSDGVCIGYLSDNGSGNGVAVGSRASAGGTSVAIGNLAGESTSGSANVFLGFRAGRTSSSGSSCVYIGYEAGVGNTGQQNVAIGREAGEFGDGSSTVHIGYRAGQNNTASETVAIGFEAGQQGDGANSTFIGYRSGTSYTGSNATFLGNEAGNSAGSADSPTYVGFQAGRAATGNSNTFVGREAGEITSGSNNTSIGHHAGQNHTGSRNSILGQGAGLNGSGNDNTIIGYSAGLNIGTAATNIMIGTSAGAASTGNTNIFIGDQAGFSTTGDRNILIGQYGTVGASSHVLRIENSNNTPLIGGTFASSGTATLDFNASQISMSSLPTSNPGGSGLLWNDSGTLKIT